MLKLILDTKIKKFNEMKTKDVLSFKMVLFQ